MPTLLSINVVANSGSTGRIVEGIVEMASLKGWKCYTVYGRWANTSKSELYKVGNLYDVCMHYLLSRVFDMHGLASKRVTNKLIKKIRDIKPDIIHLHNIHGYYINYKILFDYLHSVTTPVVWTLHDCWAYTGHCAYYSNALCSKWKTNCYNCPNLNDYPTTFFDLSAKNYQLKKYYFTSVANLTIVPVSNWLANEVSQSFFSNYPIQVIHNGVDINSFTPVLTANAQGKYQLTRKFVILGVATVWDQRKGFDDFIKLSDHLSEDEVIILVGLSKKQISGLPKNIIGIQKTENIQKMVELYSLADIFINFSTEETFGLTTIESMACGTPVIVYDVTACPEVVTEQTGFVVPPHDIHKVINIIKSVREVGKMKYYSCCRKHILNNYSQYDRYEEYLSLYNRLLKE